MSKKFRKHKTAIEHFFLNDILQRLEGKRDFDEEDISDIESKISDFMSKVEKGEYKCERFKGLVPYGEKISDKLGVEGPNGLLVYNPKFKYLNKRKVLTIIYLEILNKEINQVYSLDDEFRSFLQEFEQDEGRWKEFEKRYISWRNKLVLMEHLAGKLDAKNDLSSLESLKSSIENRIRKIEEIHRDKISRSFIEGLIEELEKEENQLSRFDTEVDYEGTGYKWARKARRPGQTTR